MLYKDIQSTSGPIQYNYNHEMMVYWVSNTAPAKAWCPFFQYFEGSLDEPQFHTSYVVSI